MDAKLRGELPATKEVEQEQEEQGNDEVNPDTAEVEERSVGSGEEDN